MKVPQLISCFLCYKLSERLYLKKYSNLFCEDLLIKIIKIDIYIRNKDFQGNKTGNFGVLFLENIVHY